MASDIEFVQRGLNLVDLAKVRTGDNAGKIAASEGLDSQVAYMKETRQAHGYSKAIDKLFGLVFSYVEDAEEAALAGRRNATWTNAGFWAPFYFANDAVPISMGEVGRLGSADSIAVADDYFQVPKESCPMVGSVLGEFYLRANRTIRRLLVYNAACEPLNLAWELLRDEGYELYRIESANRPNAVDDEERVTQLQDFFKEQLKDLAIWLSGKPVSEERLSFEIRRHNRLTAKIRQILYLRLENPLYIRSLATMYLLSGLAHAFGKPEAFEEVLDLLIEELQTADVIPPRNGKLVRLAWVGGRGQEFGVYKTIDDAGGAVTGWHNADDWSRDYREDIDPLQAYAEYVVTARPAGSPVRQLQRIEEYLPAFGATGILFYGYIGCSFGSVHREILSDHFHKKGIPSIQLEGTFQVGPPTGQLLTRVRAFIEMLSR
jgi:benzoyl-CoA reductase/2-hydroxyglutaryl-CoA dehydratase subunit BcrC/BadD/HgdB